MQTASRAKEIIEKILYITVATVSAVGEPWNTPVYSAYNENYNFFWASDRNGQHSKNIRENNKVFLVIYDSTVPEGTGEGVYVKATANELEDEEEIKQALALLYKRKNQSPEKRVPQEFLGEYPRRIYKAVPQKVWMNGEGSKDGHHIDTRVEIIF